MIQESCGLVTCTIIYLSLTKTQTMRAAAVKYEIDTTGCTVCAVAAKAWMRLQIVPQKQNRP